MNIPVNCVLIAVCNSGFKNYVFRRAESIRLNITCIIRRGQDQCAHIRYTFFKEM